MGLLDREGKEVLSDTVVELNEVRQGTRYCQDTISTVLIMSYMCS